MNEDSAISFLPSGQYFATEPLMLQSIHERVYYTVTPSIGQWTYEEMFIFINQFPDSLLFDQRVHKIHSELTIPFSVLLEMGEHRILFKIDIQSNSIDVKVDREILKQYFLHYSSNQVSVFSTRKRLMSNSTSKIFIQFFLLIQERQRGTRFFTEQQKGIYYKKQDFHPSMKKLVFYLADKISRSNLSEVVFLVKNLFQPIFQKDTVSSLVELSNLDDGFLFLFHFNCSDYSHYFTLKTNEGLKAVLYGIYISPFASSLLLENEVDALILDTTFKLLPFYVTSILCMIYRNTAVPLAVSFTKTECKKTYELFFDIFYKLFKIDLNRYSILSDEGKSIRSVCIEKKVKHHFYCIWHLLHKFSYSIFSFEIGLLIKSPSISDFEKMKELLNPLFRFSCHQQEKATILEKKLNKVGLTFQNEVIAVSDKAKWKQYSLIKRVKHRVPATSGLIESLHGHCNGKVPRKNTFLTAFHRLIYMCNNKVQRVDSEVLTNSQRQNRIAEMRIFKEGEEQLMSECNYFMTAPPDYCECSEKLLANALFRESFKCSHMIYMGETAEIKKQPTLRFQVLIEKLEIRYIKIEQSIERPILENRNKKIQRLSEIIVKYTRSKQKSAILDFVNAHYDEASSFVCGYPTNSIEIISIGITLFHNRFH
jgi:hypothetical protein